jgi:putative flippase GtrA
MRHSPQIWYASVSGLCLLLNNALMVCLTGAGIHYALACILSFFAVLAAGFLLHARLTFRVPATASAFVRYFTGMALNLPLSVALIWLFHDVGQAPMIVAAPAATLLLVLSNYVCSRWALRPASAPSLGSRA